MASSGAGDEPPRRSISSSLNPFRRTKKTVSTRDRAPTTTTPITSQPVTPTTVQPTYPELPHQPPTDQQEIPQHEHPSQGSAGSSDHGNRTYIEPIGDTFNPHTQASHKITSIIRSNFEGAYTSWKKIPINVRDMWFREFEGSFYWHPQYNSRIRKNFEKGGSKRMRDEFTEIRRDGEKPHWIGDAVWAELCRNWGSPEYVRLCQQNKLNRASDSGGLGTSKSTCGSRPLTQHRIQMAKELGREPTLSELHTRTHTKKGTQEWVDDRARVVHEGFTRLKEQHSQSSTGDGTSSSSQVPSDFTLWKQAAGGKNRGRTYGLGTQGPAIEAQSSYASPSDFTGMNTFDLQKSHHDMMNRMEKMQQQQMEMMAMMQRMEQRYSSQYPPQPPQPPQPSQQFEEEDPSSEEDH